MAELSTVDHFRTILDFAVGIADRGIPLSLVMIEPDGWPEGEPGVEQRAALEQLGKDVAARTRRSDRVTRLTDRRFAALLMDCNRQGALISADRLQMAAENFTGMSGHSVSCAIAVYRDDMEGPEALLAAAGEALEAAHRAGGDRIEIFGDG